MTCFQVNDEVVSVFLSVWCKRLIWFVSRSFQLKRYFRMDTYTQHHLRSHPAHRNQHKTERATKDKKDKRSGELANRWVRGMPFCVYNKTGSGKRKCQKALTPPLLKLMVGVFSTPRPKLKGKHWHLLRMCPFQLESSQVGKFLSMWTVRMCTFNRNPEHFCRSWRIDCWGW